MPDLTYETYREGARGRGRKGRRVGRVVGRGVGGLSVIVLLGVDVSVRMKEVAAMILWARH